MRIITPAPYVETEDGYDWCEGCGYLEKVAATISPDGIEPLQPICRRCEKKLGGE